MFFDYAIDNCKTAPALYYVRGLLMFYMHSFYEALLDFDTAIERDDDPSAHYYLARGRCYACLSMLSEAMKDLSIAISLDENLLDVRYLYCFTCRRT